MTLSTRCQTQRHEAGHSAAHTTQATHIITETRNVLGQVTRLTDPDLGTWLYENNALGQLVKQTDALNKSTTLEYDLLGSLKRRVVEPDHESRWVYDTQYAVAPTPAPVAACARGARRSVDRQHHDRDT